MQFFKKEYKLFRTPIFAVSQQTTQLVIIFNTKRLWKLNMFEERFDVDAIGCQSGLSIYGGKTNNIYACNQRPNRWYSYGNVYGSTPIDLSVNIFRLYSSEQIAYSVYNGDILIHENPICH